MSDVIHWNMEDFFLRWFEVFLHFLKKNRNWILNSCREVAPQRTFLLTPMSFFFSRLLPVNMFSTNSKEKKGKYFRQHFSKSTTTLSSGFSMCSRCSARICSLVIKTRLFIIKDFSFHTLADTGSRRTSYLVFYTGLFLHLFSFYLIHY